MGTLKLYLLKNLNFLYCQAVATQKLWDANPRAQRATWWNFHYRTFLYSLMTFLCSSMTFLCSSMTFLCSLMTFYTTLLTNVLVVIVVVIFRHVSGRGRLYNIRLRNNYPNGGASLKKVIETRNFKAEKFIILL